MFGSSAGIYQFCVIRWCVHKYGNHLKPQFASTHSHYFTIEGDAKYINLFVLVKMSYKVNG